jgi:four helix bundle protein
MTKKVRTHRDLEAYRKGFDAAMQIFEFSKSFPREETYSLTDQFRRSSRSVCANLAEAWRKRRYEKAFISKLSDAESEAAETQVWLEFAVKCGYLPREAAQPLYRTYDEILRLIVSMINHPEHWVIGNDDKSVHENPEKYNELF